MKLSIVTLTYNQLEAATKPFIESLYEFTDANDFELTIVDNASTDGTVEYLHELRGKYSNVKVIFNDENTGYSRGNNIGLREVGDTEYIGLFNNDLLFTPGWLDAALTVFEEDKKIGMVSPRTQKGKKLTKENYLQKYKKYLAKFKTDFDYNVTCMFYCVILRREVFEKVGFLDENFTPAWYEDDDYSFRVLYAGYKNAIANRSFVFHNQSTTSSKLPEKEKIIERNRQYFYDKHPLGKCFHEMYKKNYTSAMIKKFFVLKFR